MPKILLTGASGFIGKNYLSASHYQTKTETVSLQRTEIANIDFDHIQSIVHLAGIAHRMDQPEGQIYYDVNTNLTTTIAQRAKFAGVKQFIFVSTIKVFGDKEGFDIHYDTSSPCEPDDDYGKSKWQAEQQLQELQDDTFSVAIIRPSLVYGAGVKGNLEKLMNLAQKGYKLPFGSIQNERSMVYVGNLIALIDTIIEKQASGVFIAGDAQALSTSQLIQNIQIAFGQNNHLFSLPMPLRKIIKSFKPELYKRLFCSLVVDNTTTNKQLDFQPPYKSEEGIREMVEAFKEKK